MQEISKSTYKWLFYNKLFFVKLNEEWSTNGYGKAYDQSTWTPVIPDLTFHLSVTKKDIRRNYSLCIVDKLMESKEEDGGIKYYLSIHHVNAFSVSDWLEIFNYYIERNIDASDNYAYMPLLWFLTRVKWQPNQLELALKTTKPEQLVLILNILVRICVCLPLKKQKEIKIVLSKYNVEYKEYLPTWISEAIHIVDHDFDKISDYPLFALVDYSMKHFFELVKDDESVIDVSSPNKLIKLYSWLSSDNGLDDYQFLIDLFPFVIEIFRLRIVKRYLHDVRQKRTTFDPKLLSQFRDNKYGQLIRYRYCLQTPSEPIILTVPLLCDCILTLFNSKGNTFQTADGLLDFIVRNCDTKNPRVDFMMERFIPTCKDGVIFDRPSFRGFIDCSFDEKIMKIIPRKDVLIGLKYDVFGFWKNISKGLTEQELNDCYSQAYLEAAKQYNEMESQEIYIRTKKSLAAKLGDDKWKEDCFELPYDSRLLNDLKVEYFYNEVHVDGSRSDNCFLSELQIGKKYRPLCSPTFSQKHFPAIDIPYFWCRGKECFRNALGNQTLEKTNDWKLYSLYHLVEIIGFCVIEKTEGGYEPNEIVRIFIAVAYKAMLKFERLKCRECGHLLFSKFGDQFNRYNYYSCRNHVCPEKDTSIYLNFCFQCKKGLIDSRDSKQCENGWYICPNCVSCCDDAQFERMAQKYIMMKQPIPFRIQNMQGHGHNNKGLFFCPKCGSQLVQNNSINNWYYCSQCQKSYNVNQKKKWEK